MTQVEHVDSSTVLASTNSVRTTRHHNGAMAKPNFQEFAVAEVLADSNQVIGVVDADMIVRWVSKSADGYGLDAIGRSIADLIHPEDLAGAAQAFDGTAQGEDFEPSLMANTIVRVRLITPMGVVPFDTSGRWVTDDNGDQWLVAILHDVTTRYATDKALQKLAAGSNEHDSIQAVLTATRDYGGVQGAQMVWQSGGSRRTFGDLGDHVATVIDVWGDLTEIALPGVPVTMTGSDWGYALPVAAGHERLGTLVVWGIGSSPDLPFVSAAMAPLLDLAALSLKRARELAELQRQATTDQVTGLLNRHAFFSTLDRVVQQSAVMYIDLDEFKSVNDRFGHTLGDRLLSVVGRRLADAVGDDDVVGRIGGDEFAVLCRTANPAEVRAIGERILGALNQTFVIDGHRIVTGASVGIAYSETSILGRPLLDRADQALLEAKAQGKGRSVVLSSFT